MCQQVVRAKPVEVLQCSSTNLSRTVSFYGVSVYCPVSQFQRGNTFYQD